MWHLALLLTSAKRRYFTACPWHSTQGSWSIHIHGEPIKSVLYFTYIGCVISSDNSINLEITRRIQCVSSAFGALDARVWSQRGIKLATKCKLYRVFVLPRLLYSIETYTLYRRHLKKWTSIQLQHLRSIIGLIWRDRVCSGEVLQKASMESIKATLVKSQLRWAGHIVRMPDDRLPKLSSTVNCRLEKGNVVGRSYVTKMFWSVIWRQLTWI